MSDILIEQGVIIDKYVGDTIVSFFGAPIVQLDHASRVCASAILIKRKEREMNEMFLREGISKPAEVYELLNFTGDAYSYAPKTGGDMASRVYAGRCALLHQNPSLFPKSEKRF
jgi:hypothetical protein